MTPRQVFRVGCFSTETTNEPISEHFAKMFDCLAEEISTSRLPDFNFFIEGTSPRTEQKVFYMSKGEVFLKELFELLSVRLMMKYRVNVKF